MVAELLLGGGWTDYGSTVGDTMRWLLVSAICVSGGSYFPTWHPQTKDEASSGGGVASRTKPKGLTGWQLDDTQGHKQLGQDWLPARRSFPAAAAAESPGPRTRTVCRTVGGVSLTSRGRKG